MAMTKTPQIPPSDWKKTENCLTFLERYFYRLRRLCNILLLEHHETTNLEGVLRSMWYIVRLCNHGNGTTCDCSGLLVVVVLVDNNARQDNPVYQWRNCENRNRWFAVQVSTIKKTGFGTRSHMCARVWKVEMSTTSQVILTPTVVG